MARINLRKLPWLIQKEIINNMENEILFPLSLTSSAIVYLIKECYRHPIEVTFAYEEDFFKMYFHHSRIESYKKAFFCTLFEKDPACFGYLENIPCETDVVFCEPLTCTKAEAPIKLQKHIARVLSKSRDLKFIVHVKIGVEHYKWIPSVQMATLEKVNAEELNDFVNKHPDLRFLRVKNDIDGDILPDSSIFDVRTIYLNYSQKTFLNYIEHFKGIHALFKGKTTDDHIHEFIAGWQAGKYSDNIKFVFVEQAEEGVFSRTLLENYQGIEWRPEEVEYDPNIDESDRYFMKLPNPFYVHRCAIIKRETDVKIIQVFLGNTGCVILVKNGNVSSQAPEIL